MGKPKRPSARASRSATKSKPTKSNGRRASARRAKPKPAVARDDSSAKATAKARSKPSVERDKPSVERSTPRPKKSAPRRARPCSPASRDPDAEAQEGAVLITGICGRMGRLLTRKLHRCDRVVGIDRRTFVGRPKDVVHH
ncbi:MAG TPA: hypothetical protein ENK57_10525, partial [Polyangiaceae bacterium]|nr:hypothetical protein [Polyangiaceae bacterium]